MNDTAADATEPKPTLRQRVYHLIEEPLPGKRAVHVFNAFIVILILANVSAVILESVPEVEQAHYATLQAFTFSFVKLAEPGISFGLVIGYVFLNFTVLAGWSALYFGINFYLIVEDQIDQLQVLENQASSAQLAMLRYQLNPHFLFNTLN